MVQRWVGQAVLPSVWAPRLPGLVLPGCVCGARQDGPPADLMLWDLPFAVCTFTFDLRSPLALSLLLPMMTPLSQTFKMGGCAGTPRLPHLAWPT